MCHKITLTVSMGGAGARYRARLMCSHGELAGTFHNGLGSMAYGRPWQLSRVLGGVDTLVLIHDGGCGRGNENAIRR